MADGTASGPRRWGKVAALGSGVATGGAALATHAAGCWARHDWMFLALGFLMWPLGVLHGLALWAGWSR